MSITIVDHEGSGAFLDADEPIFDSVCADAVNPTTPLGAEIHAIHLKAAAAHATARDRAERILASTAPPTVMLPTRLLTGEEATADPQRALDPAKWDRWRGGVVLDPTRRGGDR